MPGVNNCDTISGKECNIERRLSFASLLRRYLAAIASLSARGDAREESYYSALASLISDIAGSSGHSDISVITQPKKTANGNPDFRIWRGTSSVVGYVEAKRPDVENLGAVEQTEQIRRYREAFPNFALTNFLEFRLYRNGERILRVELGRSMILNNLSVTPPLENVDKVLELLDTFLSFQSQPVSSAEELALELAKRTRYLRTMVRERFAAEADSDAGALIGFYEAFRQFLIGDLTPTDFADLYAQTITYGLFAARTRANSIFNRRRAFDVIPETIGILRDLFRFMSLDELPTELAWIVDDIAELLANADVSGILTRFYVEGKGKDPIVHFYETFLARYDPEERERRGVYYTPEPVVEYIVGSIQSLLRHRLGKHDGLSSDGVTLLDPAAGTMTFVARATQTAVGAFEEKFGSGGTADFIRSRILQNFFAFELMMAPYAVGHLKMAFLLEELGYRLRDDERVKFYLTNTLDMEELETSKLPGFASLAEESHLAGDVKKRESVLVILGNPPYSGVSANTGPWITELVETYKYVDDVHFEEKKHWLQDDYVKFVRFAQWKLDQVPEGVVGFITNHSYIDNPTFRGMRRSLMRSFDDIYVLDLHGSALKKEIPPKGVVDRNVFDIRQGVAITLFVKVAHDRVREARVWHSELWGDRASKYDWLSENVITSTSWTELKPTSPFYFFIPRAAALETRFGRFVPLDSIFPQHVSGIVTARDELVIDFDEPSLLAKTRSLIDVSLSDDYIRQVVAAVLGRKDVSKVENYAWSLSKARKELQQAGSLQNFVQPYLLRPFDHRYILYHEAVVWRPRFEVMRHLLQDGNIALIAPKQSKNDFGAFVSSTIGAHKVVSTYDINYYFPLYLSSDNRRFAFGESRESELLRPNVNHAVLDALAKAFGAPVTPEQVFNYVYAIMYAPAYREQYASLLKTEFARIPFTSNFDTFATMLELGKRLVDCHLLRSPELAVPDVRFFGDGNAAIDAGRRVPTYDAATERVYINNDQYFEPVPREIWEYHVGGHAVSAEWLRERAGRRLRVDEIRKYCYIVAALRQTIAIEREIDRAYAVVEDAPHLQIVL